MSGRIESEIKTEKNIENILKELPGFVADYYYSISTATTAKTCETYLKQIRGMFRYISTNTKEIKPDDINEMIVARYLKSIQTKNVNGTVKATSFSYQKTIWSSLNGLFTYMTHRRLIEDNPMNTIKRPRYQDDVKHVELKTRNLNKILQAIEEGAGTDLAKKKQNKWKERDKLIVLLFIYTGMRCTALSEIDLSDIDIDNDTLYIMDKRKTTHKYYLNDSVKWGIEDWLEKREEILNGQKCDALFISSFRSRLSSKEVYTLIGKYSEEALGYRISPHKIRAAFCTILYNKTHDIEFVKDAVGHKSVSTTSRYIIKNNNIKKKASDIMESLL